MALTLMKGSEAIAEAAIRAGARFFFGYPITPQTEIPEYMSARMPEIGGCFLQAESEVAAINMVYGAAGTGARVITSSSSPGVSLTALSQLHVTKAGSSSDLTSLSMKAGDSVQLSATGTYWSREALRSGSAISVTWSVSGGN